MTKFFTQMTKIVMKSMKKTLGNKSLRAIALSLLFIVSGIGASVLVNPASAAVAKPLTPAEANWAYSDGNQFAQDYSPQTQINSSNVQNLVMTWIWPVPSVPTSLSSGIQFSAANVDTSPIVFNGTVIFVTVFGAVVALNAANGNQLWTVSLPLDANSTKGLGLGPLFLHMHQGAQAFTASPKFFGGTPTYWIAMNYGVIYAINALTGHFQNITNTEPFGGFRFYSGLNAGIDGNSPTSSYTAVNPTNLVFDPARGILVTSVESTSQSNAARCVFKGWNMQTTPPTNIWTTYCTPPQPQSNIPLDPNWGVKQVNGMSSAQIFYPGPSANGGGFIPND